MSNNIHGLKLNKGEWAELYTMLKLLGEGKLYSADNKLEQNNNSYLEIVKIIREESEVIEYLVNKEKKDISIIKAKTEELLSVVPQKEFNDVANCLYQHLLTAKGSSVEAPAIVCDFAEKIYVSKPKAPAVKAYKKEFGGKNDIFIQTLDYRTSLDTVMGFSIKSKFGQNPTLFNAGTSSQFLFKVPNCDDEKKDEFNAIRGPNGKRGWSLCQKYLEDNHMTPSFSKVYNPIYYENMNLIRESMPAIMAWCVKDRIIESHPEHEVKETTERMAKNNPLNVKHPDIFYKKTIKDFLIAGFAGMTASREWDGTEQGNGGYIGVK